MDVNHVIAISLYLNDIIQDAKMVAIGNAYIESMGFFIHSRLYFGYYRPVTLQFISFVVGRFAFGRNATPVSIGPPYVTFCLRPLPA